MASRLRCICSSRWSSIRSRTSCSCRGTTSRSKRCSSLPSTFSVSAMRAESVAKLAIQPPARTAIRRNVWTLILSQWSLPSASFGNGFRFPCISGISWNGQSDLRDSLDRLAIFNFSAWYSLKPAVLGARPPWPLETTMKASTFYRISAVLLLLFALGHTLGFTQSDPKWGVDALLASMRSIHFEMQGSNRTYWDLFLGAGFSVGVFFLFAAILAWQLGGLPAETL